jgi:tetratricopeptide (TPR) repeat protein
LSALTREVAISYILYAFLLVSLRKNINRFCFYWILIGILPLLAIWPIIPKQGNILAFHILYFASAGFCLWMAQLRLRWAIILFAFFAAVSFYQGGFWTAEQTLLRHTRSLEYWPRTAVAQQLLMKFDDDIPGIKDMAERSHDPRIKAMWLCRLGAVYFEHRDLSNAREYFDQALSADPSDVDALDALAVVSHYKGQDEESMGLLKRALEINPSYPETLKTLGILYYIHKDFPQARIFLSRCLFFDPDNPQARDLLRLAKTAV